LGRKGVSLLKEVKEDLKKGTRKKKTSLLGKKEAVLSAVNAGDAKVQRRKTAPKGKRRETAGKSVDARRKLRLDQFSPPCSRTKDQEKKSGRQISQQAKRQARHILTRWQGTECRQFKGNFARPEENGG